MKSIVQAAVILTMGVFTIGCANNAQNGALIGTALGAGIGAGAGSFMGSAGKGALIGAGAGAVTGYIAGNEVDKSEARHEQRYTSTPPANQEPRGISKDEVVNWSRQGVKDEIIIDRIQRSGSTFRLTAADENELRDSGVSEDVVRAMKYSGR